MRRRVAGTEEDAACSAPSRPLVVRPCPARDPFPRKRYQTARPSNIPRFVQIGRNARYRPICLIDRAFGRKWFRRPNARFEQAADPEHAGIVSICSSSASAIGMATTSDRSSAPATQDSPIIEPLDWVAKSRSDKVGGLPPRGCAARTKFHLLMADIASLGRPLPELTSRGRRTSIMAERAHAGVGTILRVA